MGRSRIRKRECDVKEHRKKKRDSSSGKVRVNMKHSKRSRLSIHSHQKRKCRHSDSDSSLDSDLSSSSSLSLSPEHRRKHKIHKKDTSSKKFKKKHKKHKHGYETVKTKKKKPPQKLHEEVELLNRSGKVEAAAFSSPTAERESAIRNVTDIKAVLAPQTKVKGPMTKEEYERQQSIVRRVYDPDTGRNRLVKGDGEIIEEIVSRERHRAINKQATLGDGCSFQALTRRLL